MVFAIEVGCCYDIRDLIPGLVVEHQPTEQGLLGFDGIRRYLESLFSASSRYPIIQSSYHSGFLRPD
jgi:hypothetical protein